jgi:hypothetical protein
MGFFMHSENGTGLAELPAPLFLFSRSLVRRTQIAYYS